MSTNVRGAQSWRSTLAGGESHKGNHHYAVAIPQNDTLCTIGDVTHGISKKDVIVAMRI